MSSYNPHITLCIAIFINRCLGLRAWGFGLEQRFFGVKRFRVHRALRCWGYRAYGLGFRALLSRGSAYRPVLILDVPEIEMSFVFT